MKMKRWLAALLSLAIIMTMVNIGNVSGSAAETTDDKYTLNQNTYSDYSNPYMTLLQNESGTFNLSYVMEGYTYTFTSSDETVLKVDSETGKFTAIGEGTTLLTVTAESTDEWTDTDTYNYYIRVIKNCSKAYLSKTYVTSYADKSLASYGYEPVVTSTVSIKGLSGKISSTDTGIQLSVTDSKGQLYGYSLENNKFTFGVYGSGTHKLTITINGKVLKYKIKVVKAYMSSTSVLLYKGQKKTLSVRTSKKKAVSNKLITWKSSNKKVATVSSKGVVKAKKTGLTVISASIGGKKIFGSAVSVTTKKKVKAIKKAQSIYKTSTYSQPKRMQKGYYDCSSLVWRSYSPQGYTFGNKHYAPVAADIAKYLNKQHKLKGKLTTKTVTKHQIQAGDLVFKTGESNGRFKGIYHVEMCTGYRFYYFDETGAPVLYTTCAARGDGYIESAIWEGAVWGRP